MRNVRNAWFQEARGFLPSCPSSPAPFPLLRASSDGEETGLGGELAPVLRAPQLFICLSSSRVAGETRDASIS